MSSQQQLEIKKEIEAIREATKRICASKESAHKYLVKHGFIRRFYWGTRGIIALAKMDGDQQIHCIQVDERGQQNSR
jgi:hypothetical protein